MTPQAFYIKNHSASELYKADVAALPTLSERPRFSSKPEYAKWCHEATTDHVFFTLVEPEFNGNRSSSQNPIKFLHGIVGDFDGDAGAINACLPTLTFAPGKAPTWITTTYSNKARLIWAFEKPIPTFNPDVLTRFLNAMIKELRLKVILPGLDEGAFVKNPHTPYELGTNWRQPYGDVRIPHTVVMTILHDSCEKAKFKSDGPEIPIEAVEAEVTKRWPGRWAGPFQDGARGIRFWDAKADNQTGCTIRTNGVQAWTGECKFIPWHELLGSEFCKQYRANRIGGAIDGTYFDGMDYWNRDESGIWRGLSTEAIKRHIGVLHGLSNESKKGQQSEISQALTTVDRLQRVDGALPCLFMKDDVVRDGPQKYLNIARAKVLPSNGTKREWGDGFPWLAQYIDGIFGQEQKEVFLSWLTHFYKNAAAGKPKKGQALFIAGPRSAGKTFLSQCVVGGLMGGFQEATKYVLGETDFNEQLFHAPVWAVDDAVAAADPRRHSSYSQIVKKLVANPYQEYHAKFKKAVTFRWNGRVIVTLNDDPASITMLPNIEGSILDKIVILRASAPGVSFVGAEETVLQELPYFADFLMNWTTPAWLQTDPDVVARFGHDSWQHLELLETARESSSSAGMEELLDMWRTFYFRAHDKPEYTGTAIYLLRELQSMDEVKELLPTIARTHHMIGKDLQKMIAQGIDWVSYGKSNGKKLYTIKRPDKLNTEKKK